MATRIDLNKDQLRSFLMQSEASLKRRINTDRNPAIRMLVQKDLNDLVQAISTMSEAK